LKNHHSHSYAQINSLKNDIISTSNRVLSDKKLIEPSSDSLQTDDKRGNAIEQGGNVLISDSLLKRFNGKTFTEIFNSNEFTEDEKKCYCAVGICRDHGCW
jgi:hypothetical protein